MYMPQATPSLIKRDEKFECHLSSKFVILAELAWTDQ